MKKILLTFFILLFSLTACSKQKNPPDMSQCIVDYGNSKIFTHEILDQGINTIKKEFSKFYDFTLYSIKYTDDTTSLRELNYYNPYYDNRYVELWYLHLITKRPRTTVIHSTQTKRLPIGSGY